MQPKQDHKALIKVSDLTHYMICPRLVYFRARGYEQPRIAEGKERSAIEHILLKELDSICIKFMKETDTMRAERRRQQRRKKR
jgi:hypothetical protein